MPLKQIMEAQKAPNRKDDQNKPSQPVAQVAVQHRKGPNFPKKKDKFGRKRSQSFSGINSKFCPPYKYRTRPMLPTKFLLGGNICDPLNLNSLQDEEVNRTVNAITPKSSPIPTPPQRRGHIEVIIPPNIHDPLNLIDCADDAEYEQQLTSPLKKGSKRRKKKKRTSSATTDPSDADISASEAQMPDLSNDSAKIPDVESSAANSGAEDTSPKEKLVKVTRDLKLELSPAAKDKKRKSDCHKEGVKKLRRLDSMDKIVSPVVPQPGAWLKRAGPSNRGQHNRPNVVKPSGGKVEKLPRFRDKNKAYQYGNYNRYYGYRNPNHEVDSRLRCFAAHRNIFEGRDILDIGCNIGHITLSIARDFGAKSVVGIDIDKKLIGIARKNVRHYVNCNDSPRDEPGHKSDKCFPISMPILYGPVDVPGMQNDEVRGRGFPHNVTFVQGNYVLEDDSLLCTEQPQFDVILCLSITKWLHLNWGDQGIKQAFRRMYAQLKPGGKLILEPQSWASYKHKKTLTETIYKNYNSIEFFPEKFTQYLLSSEVGFAKSEIMGQPHHTAKGFQRPIQIFTRSNLSPSQSQRSYSITPSHTVTSGGGAGAGGGGGVSKVYTCLPSPDVTETSGEATVRVDDDGTRSKTDMVDSRNKTADKNDSNTGSTSTLISSQSADKRDLKCSKLSDTVVKDNNVSNIDVKDNKMSDKDVKDSKMSNTKGSKMLDTVVKDSNVSNIDVKVSTGSDNKDTNTSNTDSQDLCNQNANTDANHSEPSNRNTDSICTDKQTTVNRNTDKEASRNTDKPPANRNADKPANRNTDKPVNKNSDEQATVHRNADNQAKANTHTDNQTKINKNTDKQDAKSNTEIINNKLNANDTSLLTKLDSKLDSIATHTSHKRKHNSPVSPDDSTPVKRKYAASSIPVKHTSTYTKRKNHHSTTNSTENDQSTTNSTCKKNDQSTTGSTCTDNDVTARLELNETNDEHPIEYDKSTTNQQSTTMDADKSNDFRIMQTTKCMLDNT